MGTRRSRPPRRRREATRDAAPKAQPARRRRTADAPETARALEPGVLRLGAAEGSTPGTWISRWRDRHPQVRLDLVELPAAAPATFTELFERVDVALVRVPERPEGCHRVFAYAEQPVVVMAIEADLSAADELSAVDMAGETVITAIDHPAGVSLPPDALAPGFDPPATIADAIELVAAGIGSSILPMSLARLHHRRDVVYRPYVDADPYPMSLVWPVGSDSETMEEFVGVVRGRTARSSRGRRA